ncbi:heme A synthase [Roseibium denhamense]|uniref:Heme A synthase n=1 Tax=Roseibium denhamense TaxID=76305 RepID=A0ABY1NUT3_9HYPH|nr:COX15/CtaA family protein [Roseibium denhamense]MTI04843.1 heme A synthase [Roseibium denhamense]SMP18910.1 cytochrome c oxidase assembly protein subunit 15 [Roseibium denhamense]
MTHIGVSAPTSPTRIPAARLEKIQRDRVLIRWWLYGVCALILAMVVVGGATRLTESGLSITEWKPIHGVIPPLTEAEWEEELEKYRQIPEYQLINKGMSLSEFKFIFWWEWGHRVLGRIIGVAFFVPMVAFWAMGRIEPWLKPRLLIGLALGGLQGFVGWWMVTSGLVDRVDVSQYRLATHLTLALIIFAYLFWIARRLTPLPEPTVLEQTRLRGLSTLFLGLVFIQMFLGGLVAGLNAGMTFNTWPLMDGKWIPNGLLIMDPLWRNFFENVMTVQFQHRITAYVLIVAAIALCFATFRVSSQSHLRRAGAHIAAFVALQAVFGILTLIWVVPLSMALVHQGFAVIVLASAVDHLACLKGPYPIAKRATA